MKKKKPYSVFLRYPEYVSNEYPDDTFYAFVSAVDVPAAILAARESAEAACQLANTTICQLEDFALLSVVKGHHKMLAWEGSEG